MIVKTPPVKIYKRSLSGGSIRKRQPRVLASIEEETGITGITYVVINLHPYSSVQKICHKTLSLSTHQPSECRGSTLAAFITIKSLTDGDCDMLRKAVKKAIKWMLSLDYFVKPPSPRSTANFQAPI